MIKYIFLFTISLVVSIQVKAQIDQEVAIIMQDGWKINGSLIATENKSPLIILVSGSGPTDRNGNNPRMKNNSLKMLAESLAEKSFSSFRFDKRGIAASYDTSFREENLRFSDYVADLNTIVDHFENDNRFSKIVIAGHSEGALISLLVAQDNNAIDGYISIAGAGRDAKTIIIEQIDKQMPALVQEAEVVFDSLQAGYQVKKINPFLMSIFRPSVQNYIMEWASYDPAILLAHYEKPVLILQGRHDIQVTLGDAKRLKEAHPSASLVVIDSMNHILKNSGPAMMDNLPSYNDPDLAINPILIESILEFIGSL